MQRSSVQFKNSHSFIQVISIAPLQVRYYSEAPPTKHGYCVGVSRRSATGNCELRHWETLNFPPSRMSGSRHLRSYKLQRNLHGAFIHTSVVQCKENLMQHLVSKQFHMRQTLQRLEVVSKRWIYVILNYKFQ